MFFLSREETLNYLKAKDAAEREQLKQGREQSNLTKGKKC